MSDAKTKEEVPTPPDLRGLVRDLRRLELDHLPGGWPAVRMGQISALLDALDTAMADLDSVEYYLDDWNFSLGMKDKVKELCDNYFGDGIRPE